MLKFYYFKILTPPFFQILTEKKKLYRLKIERSTKYKEEAREVHTVKTKLEFDLTNPDYSSSVIESCDEVVML
jgi:hypothetical protein